MSDVLLWYTEEYETGNSVIQGGSDITGDHSLISVHITPAMLNVNLAAVHVHDQLTCKLGSEGRSVDLKICT